METTPNTLPQKQTAPVSRRECAHDDERECLANNLIDAEIHRDELRDEIRKLLPGYREAKHFVRLARARLEHFDFLESVEHVFGSEIRDVVQEHSAGV